MNRGGRRVGEEGKGNGGGRGEGAAGYNHSKQKRLEESAKECKVGRRGVK